MTIHYRTIKIKMREDELPKLTPIRGIEYEFTFHANNEDCTLILSIDDQAPILAERKTPEQLDRYIDLAFGDRIVKENVYSLSSLKQLLKGENIIKGYINNPHLRSLEKDRDILHEKIEPTLLTKNELLLMKLGIKNSVYKDVRHNYNGIVSKEKGNKFLVDLGIIDRRIDT